MYSFNTFADSFILLQSTGLSVPITHILIGHILMAFVVEFGFRSYLQKHCRNENEYVLRKA